MEVKKLTLNEAISLGVKNHSDGKLREAEIIYRQILKQFPNNHNALHLLGVIAYQVNKYEESIKMISQAIKNYPDSAVYYNDLAMAYDALGDDENTFSCFSKALEIDPKYDKAHFAHYNVGVILENKINFLEALEHYDYALEIDNNFFEAHWNKALALLTLGRLKEGWKEFEYRFKKKDPTDTRDFKKPKWDGSALDGKKILIASEQGFGDFIQFARFIPFVKEKGGYVILECKKELVRLFKDFPGVDEIVEKDKEKVPEVDYDHYIHIMSLPNIINIGLEEIPREIYLKADSDIAEKFKSKIDSPIMKIGIVWSGNPDFENNKSRSIDLNYFNELKETYNVELISLQKGKASEELKGFGIINLEDEINDFADTAAIIENLDLIISVDTSVTHLAGAMGKSVWVLLSKNPGWRWLLDRNDSPWYPSMRLFRQKDAEDWDYVFDEIREELKKKCGR